MDKAGVTDVERFAVADASPLIGLAIVDGLAWLPEIFAAVYLPETVKQEVLPGRMARGEKAIAEAIAAGWINIWPEAIENRFAIDLDLGETDCINLALSYPGKVLLIMDERAGRAVAKEKAIPVIGTAAIIGQAKKMGLIDSAKAAFESLHSADFRIAPAVIRQILQSVGE